MEALSPSQHCLTVDELGHSGDGLVRYQGHVFYVSGVLPGEKVRVRLGEHHADLLECDKASPARVVPPCPLFGECGGCSVQHMALPALLEWKTSRVRRALERAGYEALPSPKTFQTLPSQRQRVDLAVQRVHGGVVLGLHQRGGDPVDMTSCSVLHPQLVELLPPLRKVLSSLGALTGRGAVAINLLESGADITLEIAKPLSHSDREKLATFARHVNVPRISWRAHATSELETAVQWAPVFHRFAGKRVTPPPASFLQATRAAEHSIVQAVLAGLPPLNRKDRIIELYAGCGTLTFPMAEKGYVKAYEGSHSAIQALNTAAQGIRAEGHIRDLNRQPLLPHDLKEARVVVLDPPYQGAGKQLAPLAHSSIQDVVYISCNPAALSNDLALLRQKGFDLISWHVVDQFLWSGDVETVITLTRDQKRLRKARHKKEA